jgi:hypothetical protein
VGSHLSHVVETVSHCNMLFFLQFEHRKAIVKEDVGALTDGKTDGYWKGRRKNLGESGWPAAKNVLTFCHVLQPGQEGK